MLWKFIELPLFRQGYFYVRLISLVVLITLGAFLLLKEEQTLEEIAKSETIELGDVVYVSPSKDTLQGIFILQLIAFLFFLSWDVYFTFVARKFSQEPLPVEFESREYEMTAVSNTEDKYANVAHH
mmetsp:Transcript_17419/g.16617  ORF Transcript_17419/g.16617 Transcript_17419/m.16617 type:complete len:126 (+) Transcript_17419:209-586(+)